MKFTDMNFDCLETVLEYLELIDLLNVADSTKLLKKAAELVFDQKHGNKAVKILKTRISRHRTFGISRHGAGEYIDIDDLKTALQLLRCFGPVISKIRFREFISGDQPDIDPKVLTYINKYCADYLKELDIHQMVSIRNVLNYFNRPFPKLTKLKNRDLEFNEKSCLNRLFPKIRCLNVVHTCNLSFYKINTKHFPYLKELYICNYGDFEPDLRNEILINLLQLNPQLKKLDIHSWGKSNLNTDLIRSAVDSLQNVEHFSFELMPSNSKYEIRMKSVKSFNIILYYPDFSSYFPFAFENLESFYIDFPQLVNSSFNDQFYNFIDRHTSITKFSSGHIVSNDVLDWSRLAKSLSLLLEIELPRSICISADEAIEIMDKFKMLKIFSFRLSDGYDNFRKRLSKNWEGTSDRSGYVDLKRKM